MQDIYGLVDPLDAGHVRYVGMAFKAQRPYQHSLSARNKLDKHSHLFHWIRSLHIEGPKVVMSVESNKARSKAHTGRAKSESHRAALSVAAKERERRKREKKND